MKLYLMVTDDKYELPIAVATNVNELSRMSGKSVNTIRSAISHKKAGRIKRSMFCEIKIRR